MSDKCVVRVPKASGIRRWFKDISRKNSKSIKIGTANSTTYRRFDDNPFEPAPVFNDLAFAPLAAATAIEAVRECVSDVDQEAQAFGSNRIPPTLAWRGRTR